MQPPPFLSLVAVAAIGVAAFAYLSSGATEADDRPASAVEITFHRDVVYGRAGEQDLTLSLAVPNGLTRPAPTVAVIHGGAWMSGRKEMHDRMIEWLARQGYVAATIGYRLAPRNPWPAQIHDVKCAVRYLRANAEKWKIDPERLAAWGFSAGGHLGMLLGTMDTEDGLEGDGGHPEASSKVDAVVSFYGPADLDPQEPGRMEQVGKRAVAAILGPEFAKDPKKASPVHYVDERDAPMILLQGTRDRLVPYLQAVDMLDRLSQHQVEAEVVFLVGQGHGWRQDPALSDSVRTALRFLDRRFRPGRAVSIREEVMVPRRSR